MQSAAKDNVPLLKIKALYSVHLLYSIHRMQQHNSRRALCLYFRLSGDRGS